MCKSEQNLSPEADIKALSDSFFPGPLRNRRSVPEVLMFFTVALAVGLDSSLVAGQSSAWQSAGHSVTLVKSIGEAIVHLREGDFDLVLLGHSIPTDSRERFTFLIRESGSRTPVISLTDPPKDARQLCRPDDRKRVGQSTQKHSRIHGRTRRSIRAWSRYAGYCSMRACGKAFSSQRSGLPAYQSAGRN